MDELTLGGKKYLSSKQGAKVTGYSKDYVGQLCREGRVRARLVGRSWYVLESSIREHRFGSTHTPKNSSPKKHVTTNKGMLGGVRYTSEEVVSLHELSDDSSDSYVKPQTERKEPYGVSIMQEVWHGWFSSSKPEEENSGSHNEVIDLRDDNISDTHDNTIKTNVNLVNTATDDVVDSGTNDNLNVGERQNIIHNSLPTEGEVLRREKHYKPSIPYTPNVNSDVSSLKTIAGVCSNMFSHARYNRAWFINSIVVTISVFILLIAATSAFAGQMRHETTGLFWTSVNYVGGVTEFVNI